MVGRRDVPTAVVRLCRALRDRGVAVTPAESVSAVAALDHLDIADRAELRRALRVVLARRREDIAIVDELFDAMWAPAAGAGGTQPPRVPRPAIATRPPSPPRAASVWVDRWAPAGQADDEGEEIPLRAPSDRESLRRRDLASLAGEDVDAMLRVARRLARRLARRPSRRWRAARGGASLDLRRTVRWSLRTAGETAELARRERKVRRTSLVIACDVSGSMELYSRFLLQFLFAMQSAFARVETFVFGTRLSRATGDLRTPEWEEALARLSAGVHDWAGGTRIGASLDALARDWPAVLDRRTIVIVLSDGWDTGDPALLGDAMAAIRARAGKVIWLNPLLGSPDYRPLARGMQSALPHVDVFAPAHDLASLESLACHLVI
ncbi:MAG TPA: VWA domain-containing protein [Gemmatimonadaceae bacterium]|nr:VWA domain-containing protein [Gemmatimonadaceae bacterium]